ncbi:MAG: peptidoglycan-binding protein [Pseudolabrys sp.]|nr:peptidoglycan-binding protein [Pseudolabrys sp.]
MSTREQLKAQLKAQRASLEQPFAEAVARGDKATQDKLEAVAMEIDFALDGIATQDLAILAETLAELRGKIEILTQKAKAWPFGLAEATADHERPLRGDLAENDFADPGPNKPAPAPAPVPVDAIPAVKGDWAKEYKQLWKTMAVSADWKVQADAIAKKIVASQGRYAAAVGGTNVPWWFVAVVHAMECSLRFSEHLHNGDPLTAQTVRVPRGRPPTGSAPFLWEDSARDSIAYEKLDKVTDWSLPSVLYHWHRYNGINNEYKRRNIPTPYLWSGCQHYRQGKYVADGVFDPDKVSRQVGAAVLLKSLIDLGAVTIDTKLEVGSNAAAATGHVASLSIDTSGAAFAHVAAELDYPGPLKVGSGTTAAEKKSVRRVQEWLNIHGFATAIDGGFGDSTGEQLVKFQGDRSRQPSGELDEETWALLTAPIRRALAAIDHGDASSLENAVVRVARQHINEAPLEVGGNNCGPWVRLYMKGAEGSDQKWCSGFVCFVVAQAARDLNVPVPFKRQVGVDQLVKDAKTGGRFIAEGAVADAISRRSKLRPGYIFVVRDAPDDWIHTGLVLGLKDQTFDTLEGNTGGDGGTDGANARDANRPYRGKDFLRLL